MFNTVLFVVFPYLAVTVCVVMSVYRYIYHRFSYSSLSSEIVENKMLFWGAVP